MIVGHNPTLSDLSASSILGRARPHLRLEERGHRRSDAGDGTAVSNSIGWLATPRLDCDRLGRRTE